MALLYLAWFIIEIPFVFQRFADSSPWEFLRCLFFSNTFFASWYISASIEGMALCVLLSKWLSTVYLLLIGSVVFFLSLLGGGYYGLIPSNYQDVINSIDNIIPLTNSVISAFLYIVLGKLFAERMNSYKRFEKSGSRFSSGLLLACFSLLYTCEICFLRPYHRYTDTFLLLPFLAWSLLYFATMSPFWRRFPITASPYFRKTSTLVYFMHFIILSVITPSLSSVICDRPVVLHSVKFASATIICMAISCLIIKLSKKWIWLKYLY